MHYLTALNQRPDRPEVTVEAPVVIRCEDDVFLLRDVDELANFDRGGRDGFLQNNWDEISVSTSTRLSLETRRENGPCFPADRAA